jgi:hypothetical protein
MASGYVVSFVHGYSICLMLYLPASMLYVLRLSRRQMDLLGFTRQNQHGNIELVYQSRTPFRVHTSGLLQSREFRI